MKRSYTLYFIAGLLALHACIRDEVLPAPIVSTVSQDPAISGTIMIIKGNHFDPATLAVLVDGVEAYLPSTPTSTELTMVVPTLDDTRRATFLVKTKYGASAPFEITIHPPAPVITKIIPAKAGKGKQLKLLAANTKNLKHVIFHQGEVNAKVEFLIKGDTVITTIPVALQPGVCDVQLETPSGFSAPSALTILAAPQVNQLIPESGAAGSVVRLVGQNLREVNMAHFGNERADILAITSEYVDVRVPVNAVTDTITVDGLAGKARSKKPFAVLAKPTITTISKMTGAEGDNITINGTSLDAIYLISFGGVPSTISSNTSTRVITKVPVGAQSGKIVLTNKAGTVESAQPFLVAGKPAISNFEPTSGTVNTTVTINGVNLSGVTSVNIGDRAQTIVAGSLTDQQVKIRVVSGTVTGKVSVTGPSGTFESTQLFTVTGTPQITSLDPSSGAPGSVVTIRGINFPTSPTVTFSSGATATITKATATEITCQVPANAITGTVNVSGAVSPSAFTVTAKPLIQSFQPVRGIAGTDVTINGKYFTGSSVRFSNNVAATVSSITDSKIVVKVPAGVITGKITVTNSTGATATETNFEIISAPTITSLSPASATVGSSITINGTNLHYSPSVKFSGNITAVVESFKSNQIIVKVPTGAGSGPISVTTEGGTAQSGTFTVIGKPAINTISPTTGVYGEMITISGSNFTNPLSIVFDGSEYAATATGNVIQLRVPKTTTFNKNINVAVKTAADISNNVGFGLLAPPDPSSLKLKPNNNPVNWPVLLEGANLNTVTRVTVDGIAVNLDYKASNAITFKVPSIATNGNDKAVKIRLYYTSDHQASYSTEMNFTVLNAPPPGAFPPPIIFLPPPPPITFAPNIDANWPIQYNEENEDSDWGGFFRDIRLDTDQDGQLSGSISVNFGEGTGSFNGGYVTLWINGQKYEGTITQTGCMILFNTVTWRQLVIGFCDCQNVTCTN